jgi:hypothetical protein
MLRVAVFISSSLIYNVDDIAILQFYGYQSNITDFEGRSILGICLSISAKYKGSRYLVFAEDICNLGSVAIR